MPTDYVPKGFHAITPYLIVKGADELLKFLERAFAAEVVDCARRPDGIIAHASARIGDSIVELSEARPDCPVSAAALHLYVPNAETVYELALKAGATSLYPPATRFYGDREAGVRDPCGNTWFLATHVEDVAPDELEKRAAAATK